MIGFLDFDLESPVDRYLASLNSPESIRTQRSKLRAISKMMGYQNPLEVPWEKIKYDQINLLLTTMKREGKKRNTINATISAIKGVYTELMRKKEIDLYEYELIRKIKTIKGDDSEIGKALSPNQVQDLFIKSIQKPIQIRDNAIIAVMVGCGLRRIEVTRIKREDVKIYEKTPYLEILGKGGKKRRVYIPEFALYYITEWILFSPQTQSGYLFVAMEKDGKIVDHPLTTQRIYIIVKSRLQEVAPHDLRRTFITRLLELENDLSTVQKIAGHASPTTTVRYDKRQEHQQIKAIRNLSY